MLAHAHLHVYTVYAYVLDEVVRMLWTGGGGWRPFTHDDDLEMRPGLQCLPGRGVVERFSAGPFGHALHDDALRMDDADLIALQGLLAHHSVQA